MPRKVREVCSVIGKGSKESVVINLSFTVLFENYPVSENLKRTLIQLLKGGRERVI